jgi:hypothetical protein
MQLGEVYRWETDQVQGHDKRLKLQVFICPEDPEEVNFFLFINTVDWYKDHKILQANYKEFLEYDSFIACNAVARYSNNYLNQIKPKAVGKLTNSDLKTLRDAIIGANTMEQRDMNRVCKALAVAL